MTEAERIAAGLSDLDKRILLHGLPHQRRKILAGLPNKLVSAATGRITKLGLAVRKVLETDNAQHGSNTTKAKQRECANALGDFLSWLRETAK